MSRNRPSSGAWKHKPIKSEPRAPFPLIIACAFLFVMLVFVVAEKAFGQAAYDQINAGQYTCGTC